MIGSRTNARRAAAIMLAASLLCSGAIDHRPCLLAADSNRLEWAPSREEAIIVDGIPASMLPENTALSKSLQAKRPPSLSRPAPTRPRTYVSQLPMAGEPLPSVTGTPLSPEGLPVLPGIYYDENGVAQSDGTSGDPCCNPCCGPAAFCGRGGWGACGWIPICIFVPQMPRDGLEVFGGVQGFTGPANRGGVGSFGFHEGFNWGMPIASCMAWQFGMNWTQNNFNGNYLTADSRNQLFLTGGLYRRVDWGFQGGVVVDYLHDAWDYNADLLQLRGELSWLWCGCNEVGFWFTAGLNDAENLVIRQPVFDQAAGTVRTFTGPATLAVNDLYAFFFRRQFARGGQGRLFGGFTSHAQGLFGGDAWLPMSPNWGLRSSFIYVSADGDNSATDPKFMRESWNVSISLVWTPCPRGAGIANYCRPLFNVADNGTFLTRLLPQ
jgi:hypothetical protein